MFIVRFIRRDRNPSEEYFYNAFNEALYHIHLFRNDGSGLYNKVELVFYSFEYELEEVVLSISFD